MKKRLIALCAAITLITSVIVAAIPVFAAIDTENSLLISDCETTTGWSRLPTGATFAINNNGMTGKALGIDTTNGTLRGIVYAAPQALDASEYTKIEWDMFFGKAGDPAVCTWTNITSSTIYQSLIGVEISSSLTDFNVYKLDKLTATPVDGMSGWYHFSIVIDDATAKNGSFNPAALQGFKFYTNPSAGVDAAVPNTLMKLDNVYATTKKAVVQVPDTMTVTDCTPVGTSKVEDANGTWSRLPVGQPIEFQNDTVLAGGTAITVTASYGTLRELKYTLKNPTDISAYTRLEWDMRVWKEGDPATAMWETICSAYGDRVKVVIASANGTLTIPSTKITANPMEGKTACYDVSVNLADGVVGGTFDASAITSFGLYTNADGAAVTTLPNAIIRLDNLVAAKGENGGTPPVDPPDEDVLTWDIGSGEFTQSNNANITYAIQNFMIDASQAAFEDLALTLSIYVENLDNPGDLSGFTRNNSEGQIELTSSGTSDSQEFNWSLPKQGLQAGWNSLRLPLKSATLAGGGANVAALNYFRLYNLVPLNNTTTFDVRIKDVKLTNAKESFPLPSFFANGMMFQQKKPMVLWGNAESAGIAIEAQLLKGTDVLETKSATSDANGDWSLEFAARDGSYDSYTIVVKENGTDVKTISDILIGELWLSAGQSNMEFPVYQTVGGAELVSAADDRYMRFLMEPSIPAGRNEDQPYSPEYTIPGARWGFGNVAGDVSNVSAVAYNMALKLRDELDVPVGFINAALGATVIETWMSRESIESNPAVKDVLVARGIYKTEATFNTATDKWNQLTAMYNSKIAPLSGMNIAGVVWYQGESNAKYAYGYYEAALTALVEDWSALFGFAEGEMPFIYSHLAPHNYIPNMPFDYLAYFAEMQSNVWAAQPASMSQITIYDLPLKYSNPPVTGFHPIHPSDKTPVGLRFASAALSNVYGIGDAGYTAPVYKNMQVNGSKIILTFDEVGSGLGVIGSTTDLKGFAICGSDRVFVGAKARVASANTVEVWSDGITSPVAVTYGFSTFNMASNLKNSYGLPAVPFRTDKVESTYFYPNDWTSCDNESVWVSHVETLTAGFEPTWKKAPVSGTDNVNITYDTGIKHQGEASLKLTYTPDGNGIIGVGPVLNHPVTRNLFSSYKYITVAIRNADARTKKLELLMKGGDGNIYKAGVAVQNTNLATAYSVVEGDAFVRYVFDLSVLINQSGNRVSSAASVLAGVTEMQFTLNDTNSGAVYMDDIQFAMQPVAAEAGIWQNNGTGSTTSTTTTTTAGGTSSTNDNDDTTTGSTTSSNTSGSPDTGDSSSWFLFLIAVFAGVGLISLRKKMKI